MTTKTLEHLIDMWRRGFTLRDMAATVVMTDVSVADYVCRHRYLFPKRNWDAERWREALEGVRGMTCQQEARKLGKSTAVVASWRRRLGVGR